MATATWMAPIFVAWQTIPKASGAKWADGDSDGDGDVDGADLSLANKLPFTPSTGASRMPNPKHYFRRLVASLRSRSGRTTRLGGHLPTISLNQVKASPIPWAREEALFEPAGICARIFLMRPIVQISLDRRPCEEAFETAEMACGRRRLARSRHAADHRRGDARRAGACASAFPDVPIVADLKTMDGGYLEAELMAKAGATHVVVMARAHEETIRCVVKAGRDFGVKVMGDNLGCPDMVAGAKLLEDLGCDFVIHHIGYDERRGIAAARRSGCPARSINCARSSPPCRCRCRPSAG